ncbi:MAG: hypothetical protein ACRDBT_03820 [Aeromonas sp.]
MRIAQALEILYASNATAFAKPCTSHDETAYLRVRMLCQMELTRQLLVQAVMN